MFTLLRAVLPDINKDWLIDWLKIGGPLAPWGRPYMTSQVVAVAALRRNIALTTNLRTTWVASGECCQSNVTASRKAESADLGRRRRMSGKISGSDGGDGRRKKITRNVDRERARWLSKPGRRPAGRSRRQKKNPVKTSKRKRRHVGSRQRVDLSVRSLCRQPLPTSACYLYSATSRFSRTPPGFSAVGGWRR